MKTAINAFPGRRPLGARCISRRIVIATGLAGALLLASGALWAQTTINDGGIYHRGSVIGDDVFYSVGGGRAVSMGPVGQMRSLGVGIGWNSNLICGDMSITTTLQNQLNGITHGFQTIMSQVIENATQAVASLPALIIQRADPGLYNLLTNGILQARLDFDRSKLTCRAIANRMADMAGGQLGWDQLGEGMALKQAVTSTDTDAVSAIEQAEANRGNDGVPWVGGDNAGGEGQAPIRVVGDVTRAGYNLLNGRDATDTSTIDNTTCGHRLSCQAWSSPEAAAAWAIRVLGEQEQRTCDNCEKTRTVPGVGLTPLIQEEYETKFETLRDLVTGAEDTSFATLAAAGSASLPITRGVIEALRDEPDQDILARRLASEVALSSAEVSSGGGYPSCRQWWLDGDEGLRDRLLAQVDPGLLSRFAQWAGFLDQAEVNDAVIRAIASPRQQVMNRGQVYTDYGGQIGISRPNQVTRVASDLGMTVGAIGAFPAMDVVRQALPMVLSFLKMAMVICIPLVLIVGAYDLRMVVTVSCVEFALFFVDFWFQLARWVDSTILDALYGWHSPHSTFNPLMGLNNAFGDMLLNFVMATMFIILPAFWIAALAWAGVRAGNIAQMTATSTDGAKSAGGKAVNKVV